MAEVSDAQAYVGDELLEAFPLFYSQAADPLVSVGPNNREAMQVGIGGNGRSLVLD